MESRIEASNCSIIQSDLSLIAPYVIDEDDEIPESQLEACSIIGGSNHIISGGYTNIVSGGSAVISGIAYNAITIGKYNKDDGIFMIEVVKTVIGVIC